MLKVNICRRFFNNLIKYRSFDKMRCKFINTLSTSLCTKEIYNLVNLWQNLQDSSLIHYFLSADNLALDY